jgi:hypothetical protein
LLVPNTAQAIAGSFNALHIGHKTRRSSYMILNSENGGSTAG